MLEIVSFTLGPVQTNAYLIADPETKEAAVIDPSWDGQIILADAQARGWRIGHIWYTHAHFDHIGGAAAIADALNPLPLVALHPADHVLWRAGGGGRMFGFRIDPGPEPSIDFMHGQTLKLGSNTFEVRHVPGGNWESRVNSIRTQVYTLPDETRLLSGHGPETTVGEEKVSNPFVQEF